MTKNSPSWVLTGNGDTLDSGHICTFQTLFLTSIPPITARGNNEFHHLKTSKPSKNRTR